jgi:hypothetical protein
VVYGTTCCLNRVVLLCNLTNIVFYSVVCRLLAALAAALLALAAALLGLLRTIRLDKSEHTLAGLVSSLLKTLLLLGGSVLLLGDNSTVLVHDKVVLQKTSRGLVSGLMPDLGAGTLKFFVFTSVDMVMAIAGFHVLLHHGIIV